MKRLNKKNSITRGSTSKTHVDRRSYLRAGGAVGLSLLAGCISGGDDPDDGDEELTELHVLEAESSVHAIYWMYGITNGAWEPHGIDLTVEIAAFEKYNRQVIAGLSEVSGALSVPAAISQINQGEDLAFYGAKLNHNNEMLTKQGSGFTDIPDDLYDARVGVPFETSTTTTAHRGILLREFDFDILEDPALVRSAAPPVLWTQLNTDELDVILQFDTFTLEANTSDEYRTLLNPHDYWTEEMGYNYPQPTTLFTTYRDWLHENPQLALDYMAGWKDCIEMTEANIDEAVRNFGRLGAITTDEQAEVLKDWIAEGRTTAEVEYTQEYAENNWEFFELLHEGGGIEAVPEIEDHVVTHDMLRNWANE